MSKSKNICPRLVSEEEVLLQSENLRRLAPTVNWEAVPRKKGWRFMCIDQIICHFWERVDTSGSCWTWSGCRNKRHYGVLGFRYTTILAHRLSYILCRGQIPSDRFVLHRCDNPPCVNPDHLFLGTSQDNSSDMVMKGRHRRTAKLSEAQVLEIVRRYKNETAISLAEEFGVHYQTVNHIVNGRRWERLTNIKAKCTRR